MPDSESQPIVIRVVNRLFDALLEGTSVFAIALSIQEQDVAESVLLHPTEYHVVHRMEHEPYIIGVDVARREDRIYGCQVLVCLTLPFLLREFSYAAFLLIQPLFSFGDPIFVGVVGGRASPYADVRSDKCSCR